MKWRSHLWVIVWTCVFVAESRRPVEDCFLAVLSSHGEEGCVFGSDGKPVQLSRIFAYFDNKCMEKKTKVFLIQVRNARTSMPNNHTDEWSIDRPPCHVWDWGCCCWCLCRPVEEAIWTTVWRWIQPPTPARRASFSSICQFPWIRLWCMPRHQVSRTASSVFPRDLCHAYLLEVENYHLQTCIYCVLLFVPSSLKGRHTVRCDDVSNLLCHISFITWQTGYKRP